MNWWTDIEAGCARHTWATPTSTPLTFYCATDCRLKINTASSAAFSPTGQEGYFKIVTWDKCVFIHVSFIHIMLLLWSIRQTWGQHVALYPSMFQRWALNDMRHRKLWLYGCYLTVDNSPWRVATVVLTKWQEEEAEDEYYINSLKAKIKYSSWKFISLMDVTSWVNRRCTVKLHQQQFI